MIKKLLFLVVLVTSVAHDADPTADFHVQIPSDTIQPPAGAVAAGFTTLAANFEFSDPFYAAQSNWLDCDNSDPTKVWHHPGWNIREPVPCNIFQTTDPTTGEKVLDLQWLSSFWVPDNPRHNILTMHTTNLTADPEATTDFPHAYYEIVARASQVTPNNQCKPLQGFWSWSTQHARGADVSPIEWDTLELYGDCGGGVDAAVHNFYGSPDLRANAFIFTRDHLPADFDPTQYHTYALRITGDGTTQTEGCSYVDGIVVGCRSGNPTGDQFSQRNFLMVQNNADASTNVPDNNFYIKTIRVWSCAGWKSTMCNGKVVTGAP